MKRIHFSFLLLLLTTTACVYSQSHSDDFFPLAVGNNWTYNYFYSDWEQLGGWQSSDSGLAIYRIVSKLTSTDSTIWEFKEVRDVLYRYSNYGTGFIFDTSYVIRDSTTFELVEYQTGNHRLSSLTTDWKSVFSLTSSLTDSAVFYRYYPSASQDTFSVVYKRYAYARLVEIFKVSYQRSIGLTRVSDSAFGITGNVPYTKHTLKSAVITSVENGQFTPTSKDFILLQSYPNPFNPLTTIPFETPTQSRVTIRIYDILGRLVDTLFDNEVQVGKHSVLWNASDRSSGVYLCVAQTNGVSKSIRLLLLK